MMMNMIMVTIGERINSNNLILSFKSSCDCISFLFFFSRIQKSSIHTCAAQPRLEM